MSIFSSHSSSSFPLGLRLGETILLSLARQIGINKGGKYIDLWNNLMAKTGIECAPFMNSSSQAMESGGKPMYTLPSIKLEKLVKAIYLFPYADLNGMKKYVSKNVQQCDHESAIGTINFAEFRHVGHLYCESMEAIMRGDGSEACRQVRGSLRHGMRCFFAHVLMTNTPVAAAP